MQTHYCHHFLLVMLTSDFGYTSSILESWMGTFFFLFSFAVVVVVLFFSPLGETENKDLSSFLYQFILFAWLYLS